MSTTVDLTATEQAVQALMELLKSSDMQTRLAAAKAILEARRDGVI